MKEFSKNLTKRLWSREIRRQKRTQLADGKSANLYFWKLTNNLRLARNPEGSAASEQMDLRMDDRGEKRTDRAVVKRERKKYRKSRKTKEARKIKDWKRYRGLREDVTIK